MKRLLLLLLLLAPALATEFVADYRVRLLLGTDGVLRVDETIAVRAEGARIRHGIYRELKLAPDNPFDHRRIAIELTGARLDGRPVPYRTQSSLKTLRVYLGDPTRYLPRGDHVFELRYRVKGALARGSGGQVLFWNVTGNDWAFPIRRAAFRLEAARPPLEVHAYVGPYGSRSEVPVSETDGTVAAQAQNLAPGEGLTLWARFPPGSYPLSAPGDPLASGLWVLAAGVLAFNLLAWRRSGQDPDGPPVIPRFEPPEGVSAALARRLVRGYGDDRVFVAGLLDLAARGGLVIQKEGGIYRLRPRHAETEALPPELEALERGLFSGRAEVQIRRQDRSPLQKAKARLGSALARRLRHLYRTGGGMLLVGPLAFGLALGGVTYRASGEFTAGLFMAGFAFAFALFGGGMLQLAALALERYRLVPGLGPVAELLKAFFAVLGFFVPALLGGGLVFLLAGFWAGLAALALGLVAALFVHLLPAYTEEGARLRRHLLGLARYLATTDEAELKRIGAPEDTPKRLERLFPFAVALGIEVPFARRVARALMQASQGAAQGAFVWYQGGGFSAGDAGSVARVPSLLVGDLSRGLAAALQSATASSSSSSGGGFSGGGVGGGGGGGW